MTQNLILFERENTVSRLNKSVSIAVISNSAALVIEAFLNGWN